MNAALLGTAWMAAWGWTSVAPPVIGFKLASHSKGNTGRYLNGLPASLMRLPSPPDSGDLCCSTPWRGGRVRHRWRIEKYLR